MTAEKRNILTLKQKYKIICLLDSGAKQADLAREFRTSTSVITAIKKDREKIIGLVGDRPNSTKKVRRSPFDVIDVKLLEWFKIQRANNIPISLHFLSEKEDQIASIEHIEGFKCNPSWIGRFKKRHSVGSKIISGESNSVNMITVNDWISNEWPRLHQDYEEKDIFNADETGLFYKMLPNRTLAFKNDDCHGGKMAKDRLTVLLCASMTGEKRLALIIGKYMRPRCFKNQNLERIHYYANKNAWMKSDIFKQELMKWDAELRQVRRKILLLIDNCPAHPNLNEVLTNIKLVFFPPNTTSVLQPMDAGVIKNFKVNYRKLLVMDLIRCIDQKIDFKPSVFDAIQMIEDSWNRVSAQTIQNCFRHSKIMLRSDENTDNENLRLEIMPIELQSESILTFFDSRNQYDNYISIDDNIETQGIDNDDNSVDAEIIIQEHPFIEEDKVQIDAALSALKIVKSFYYGEEKNTCIYNHLLDIEQDLQEKYCTRKQRQTKITEYFKIK